MPNLILLADGGSRGNPGPAASGFVILETSMIANISNSQLLNSDILLSAGTIFEQGFWLGTATNNVAEWTALEKGLEYLIEQNLNTDHIQVLMDSNLVIQQIQGKWKVKEPNLKIICERTKQLVARFDNIKFHHIYREYNSLPDKVVNQILDQNKC